MTENEAQRRAPKSSARSVEWPPYSVGGGGCILSAERYRKQLKKGVCCKRRHIEMQTSETPREKLNLAEVLRHMLENGWIPENTQFELVDRQRRRTQGRGKGGKLQ
jgi:hypothetical protein